MTIISASPTTFVILSHADGSEPLDITPLLLELTVKNALLSLDTQTGLLMTTGELVLVGQKPPNFPEALDPRRNPQRWARGSRIDVWVDVDGVMQRHPRGALRILQVPQPPRGGDDLEIEIGCDLAWLNSPDLATIDTDEFTDPTLYEPTATRAQIISYLASKSVGTNGLDLSELSLNEYPISLLQVPGLSGNQSRVDQLGAIACAAGYVLWMDCERRLRAKKVDLEQNAIATYDTGRDAIEFVLRVGDQVSAEIVRTTNFKLVLEEVTDPEPTQTVESSASGAKESEDGYSSATSASRQYNPSEIVTSKLTGTTTTTRRSEQTVLRPAGLVFNDGWYMDSPAMILATREISEQRFSEASDGKLLKEIQTIEQPVGVVLPIDYPGDLTPIISSKSITKYSYDPITEEPTEIRKETFEPVAAVFVNPDDWGDLDARSLVLNEVEVQQFQRFAGKHIKKYRRFNQKTGDAEVRQDFSNQGQNNPPAPERRQPEKIKVLKTQTATLRFSQVVGPVGDARPKDYQLPDTVISQDQSTALCALLGKLLYGQTLPASWVRPVALDHQIGDAYEPLQIYDWIEDGSTYRYLSNGDVFQLTTESFDYGADGIYLGEKLESGALSPPYRIVPEVKVEAVASTSIKVSVGHELSLLVAPRAIASTSIKLTIGLHIEVDATASTSITVTSGTTIAVSWAIAVSGENLADSEIYLYYSETDLSGGDLAALPRAAFVYGVDYDETTPIDATAFASTYGSGFYYVAPWISWLNDGNSFSSYYNMTVSSADPTGSAVINIPDELYRDSVNVGSTDASIGYVQVTNNECAIATTVILETIPS